MCETCESHVPLNNAYHSKDHPSQTYKKFHSTTHYESNDCLALFLFQNYKPSHCLVAMCDDIKLYTN